MRKALLALALVACCALMFQTAVSAGVAPPAAKSHGASLGDWAKRFFLFDGAIPVVDGSHPALYVPIFQWVCSPDIFPGESIAECLAQADGAFDVVETSLTVDGKTLDDEALEAYRAETGTFTLPLAPDNFWEVAFGVELGSSITFAADAIGVLVSPLSVGTHTIVISAASEEFGFAGELTYGITVAPPGT